MTQIHCKLKAFHPIYLDRFIFLSTKYLTENLSLKSKLIFLPKKIERVTVLRSPHVDKKARDQFERITHKRILIFSLPKMQTYSYIKVYKILKYLSSLAIGVELQIEYYVTN